MALPSGLEGWVWALDDHTFIYILLHKFVLESHLHASSWAPCQQVYEAFFQTLMKPDWIIQPNKVVYESICINTSKRIWSHNLITKQCSEGNSHYIFCEAYVQMLPMLSVATICSYIWLVFKCLQMTLTKILISNLGSVSNSHPRVKFNSHFIRKDENEIFFSKA